MLAPVHRHGPFRWQSRDTTTTDTDMNAKPLITLELACVLAPLALYAGAATAADNCDGIAAQIDARMRAGGLHDFALVVVDASVTTSGRVVGTCGSGTRRIVHVAAAGPVGAGATAATLPRRPATAALAGAAPSSPASGAAIATATTTPQSAPSIVMPAPGPI